MSTLSRAEIEKIVFFEDDKPFNSLGAHFLEDKKTLVIRQYLPRASRAWVKNLTDKSITPMERVHPGGFFEVSFKDASKIFPYLIGFEDPSGFEMEAEDPYRFPILLSDFDIHLLYEGTHFKSYEKLGAHLACLEGVPGVHFAVWAPNARSVSVVGNFNHWLAGSHPMVRVNDSAYWALFIPKLDAGEFYKFAIKSNADGQIHIKTDPYAFQAELRPHTASLVARMKGFEWHDESWMTERRASDPLKTPVSVYEAHLGSWKRGGEKGDKFLNYRDLAHEMVAYVKAEGYTHIELLPIMEHPLDQSWGYQVINYYAPTSRFGSHDDFMYFVDYCHQHGIGVLLDWVPAHFPKDGYGLANFDGRQIYAYDSWRKGEQKDWGTLIFDFGRPEVRNFLISNALFWLEYYHIDGLRVDAVASMLYLNYAKKDGEWEANRYGGNENFEAIAFIKDFNTIVHREHPGILTIAEESTAWPKVSKPVYDGGLGFSLKWDMGWMHDTLEYFQKEPLYRKFHQNMLTHTLWYAFSENFILPISHDEVVYGKRSLLEKMPGDDWQKFANLRLFLGFMFAHPGKKLLFMGSDFAQRSEWNMNQSLDWHLTQYPPHAAVSVYMRDLNRIYAKHPAFYEGDLSSELFEWIDFKDVDQSVLSCLRWSADRKELLVFVLNLTPVPREKYRIGVPSAGFYEELLNSDGKEYGGSGVGNLGGVWAEETPAHGRPFSLELVLPPLAVSIFRTASDSHKNGNGKRTKRK